MPKGNRGGQRGAGGNGAAQMPQQAQQQNQQQSVYTLDFNGDKIESSIELTYGSKDPALTGSQRTNAESWEAKRAKSKIEYGNAFDKNGKALGEKRGGKGSVKLPYSYMSDADGVWTHIHPRDSGGLGGTFSGGDMQAFVLRPAGIARAAAKEGTYSISKGANFDGQGFIKYYMGVERAAYNANRQTQNALMKEYKSGNITIGEAVRQSNIANNDMLIAMHNGLLSGQSQYGYNYTLEKR